MLLIPAIDLKDGHCVRLQQGDMALATTFSEDPGAMARTWLDRGARRLHLVDLNGAFAGKPQNLSAIKSILKAVGDEIPVQLGGGIRDLDTVEKYIETVQWDGIYVDTEAAKNAALMGFAVQFMVVAAAFQLFDGLQAVAAGALRGLQDTRVPMLVALSGYWLVGFTACIALGLGTPLEGVGVWIGLAAGLVVVSALLIWRWQRREVLGLVVF